MLSNLQVASNYISEFIVTDPTIVLGRSTPFFTKTNYLFFFCCCCYCTECQINVVQFYGISMEMDVWTVQIKMVRWMDELPKARYGWMNCPKQDMDGWTVQCKNVGWMDEWLVFSRISLMDGWMNCSNQDGRMDGWTVQSKMVAWMNELLKARWLDGWINCQKKDGWMAGWIVQSKMVVWMNELIIYRKVFEGMDI